MNINCVQVQHIQNILEKESFLLVICFKTWHINFTSLALLELYHRIHFYNYAGVMLIIYFHLLKTNLSKNVPLGTFFSNLHLKKKHNFVEYMLRFLGSLFLNLISKINLDVIDTIYSR